MPCDSASKRVVDDAHAKLLSHMHASDMALVELCESGTAEQVPI